MENFSSFRKKFVPYDGYSERLFESMICGRFRNFCTLVDSGAVDLNAFDKNGLTPLMLCCYMHNGGRATSMARKLVQTGADVNLADHLGRTLLHHAVISRRIPIIQIILETKTRRLNPQDANGNTPIHLTVMSADTHILKFLVSHMLLYNINCEIRNRNGFTPLLLACQMGRLDMARFLTRAARHSPMTMDLSTHRNARMWLEAILFIPYELDPFNCNEKELFKIMPKPIDFVPKDCRRYAINYDWHYVVGGQSAKLLQRPKSSPPKITCSSNKLIAKPPNNISRPLSSNSVSQAVIIPRAKSFNSEGSSICRSGSQTENLPSAGRVMLSQMFSLKAFSIGILPSAKPLPFEEIAPSEIECEEPEDLEEVFSDELYQRELTETPSKSKKYKAKKAGVVVTSAMTLSKTASSRRRSIAPT